MYNPIEEQRSIIDQLYHIVKESCPENFTSAECRFEYDRGYEDGSVSIGTAFSFNDSSEKVFPALTRELRGPVSGLVEELYTRMKVHTGGDWYAFTLFINEDGTVTTKFEYPDQAPVN